MWDINLREKGFYKYLMPNSSLKFACLLHFSGVQQKIFIHFSGVKHISALCIGQKPPVVSVRWDLIERSGRFSAWFVHLGGKGHYLHVEGIKVLLKCLNVWLLSKTAEQTLTIGILQHLPLLCPHQPWGSFRGGMQRGGVWGDKNGDEIKK